MSRLSWVRLTDPFVLRVLLRAVFSDRRRHPLSLKGLWLDHQRPTIYLLNMLKFAVSLPKLPSQLVRAATANLGHDEGRPANSITLDDVAACLKVGKRNRLSLGGSQRESSWFKVGGTWHSRADIDKWIKQQSMEGSTPRRVRCWLNQGLENERGSKSNAGLTLRDEFPGQAPQREPLSSPTTPEHRRDPDRRAGIPGVRIQLHDLFPSRPSAPIRDAR